MAAKSTSNQYGNVAVAIHWISALLIIVLIGSGFRADGTEDLAAKAGFLKMHVPIGITILILTLFRIFWWRFGDKKPDPVPMSSWQNRLSHAVHFLFYVVILGMAASGIGMLILSGAGPIIFGGDPAFLPDFWTFKPRAPHSVGACVIVVLFVLHAGAALYHHFFQKDGLLRRMWFGTR